MTQPAPPTLTIGPATDYLFGLAQQVVASLTCNGEPAVAVDGWPWELTYGMFYVGLSDPPPDGQGSVSGAVQRRTLGAYLVSQDAVIPCCVDWRMDVPAQKTVRDAAEAVFNAWWALVAADPSLGGLLAGGMAEITTVTSTPLNSGTATEPGRRQLISFGVRITSLT